MEKVYKEKAGRGRRDSAFEQVFAIESRPAVDTNI